MKKYSHKEYFFSYILEKGEYMKELIPLKKDIIFKTKIGELTNINLDHDYKLNNDLIEGTVLLSGTYKMTEASVVEEEFMYTIPFSIAISKRINTDTIKIEIDDFKYDIQKDILKVNIELELTCEELEKETKEIIEEDELDSYINNYFNSEPEILEIEENDIDTQVINVENEIKEENINNITNKIINNDIKYYTYKVHILREGDTLENICDKYNIKIEDLKGYNNITQLNVGEKIIIPQIND